MVTVVTREVGDGVLEMRQANTAPPNCSHWNKELSIDEGVLMVTLPVPYGQAGVNFSRLCLHAMQWTISIGNIVHHYVTAPCDGNVLSWLHASVFSLLELSCTKLRTL